MSSERFIKRIEDEMIEFAKLDEHFKSKFESKEKNIKDCCNYILNQVKKSGFEGFDDPEIYAMARHYYLEDIPKEELKEITGVKVRVNYIPELTEDEKIKTKEKAIKDYEEEVKKELANKQVTPQVKETPVVKPKAKPKKKKQEEDNSPTYSLFDLLDE